MISIDGDTGTILTRAVAEQQSTQVMSPDVY